MALRRSEHIVYYLQCDACYAYGPESDDPKWAKEDATREGWTVNEWHNGIALVQHWYCPDCEAAQDAERIERTALDAKCSP